MEFFLICDTVKIALLFFLTSLELPDFLLEINFLRLGVPQLLFEHEHFVDASSLPNLGIVFIDIVRQFIDHYLRVLELALLNLNLVLSVILDHVLLLVGFCLLLRVSLVQRVVKHVVEVLHATGQLGVDVL